MKYIFGLIIIVSLFFYFRPAEKTKLQATVDAEDEKIEKPKAELPKIVQTKNSKQLPIKTIQYDAKMPREVNPKDPNDQNEFAPNAHRSEPNFQRAKSLTEKIIEHYEKANLSEILKKSLKIKKVDSMVIASTSAYHVKTRDGQIKVFSSIRTGDVDSLSGCVSVRDKQVVFGSLQDSTLELIKLPEEDAFAAIVRTHTLLVYYGNASTWGPDRLDAEPRIILYYRMSKNGQWIFLGKGVEGPSGNSSADQTDEEFCNTPD